MSFLEIRKRILKLDEDVANLKIAVLREISTNGDNNILTKVCKECMIMQKQIDFIRSYIQESEMEDEELEREKWELEQQEMEKIYYSNTSLDKIFKEVEE